MTINETIKLDLDDITSSYESNLVDQLRGFGLEREILETWVPDENVAKSVLNLVDSTLEAGVQQPLEIKATDKTLDEESIETIVAQLGGSVESVVHEGGYVKMVLSRLDQFMTNLPEVKSLSMLETLKDERGTNKSSVSDNSQSRKKVFEQRCKLINPIYNHQVIDSEKLSSRDRLKAKAGERLVKISQDSVVFHILVSENTNRIVNARFYGDLAPESIGVFELFSEIIVDLPIQEASDHGIIWLEYELRGSGYNRPVPGILLPHMVDRRFAMIQELIRQACTEYYRTIDQVIGYNEFDFQPGSEWLELSNQERKDQVLSAVTFKLMELGFDPSDIEVLDIEYDVRVLVGFSGLLNNAKTDKQQIMLSLEQSIKEMVEPRLELYLEPVRDQSKLRRLTPDKK